MGMEGNVTIRFTLDRSGKIVDHPVIVKGNSHDVLNRAGVLTVTQAAPFPPFPEGAALRDVMTFVVTIDYNLRVN
jgi:TonB family protein